MKSNIRRIIYLVFLAVFMLTCNVHAADLTVTGAVKTSNICDEDGNNCKTISSITTQLFGSRLEITTGTYLAETDGFLHGYIRSYGTAAKNVLIYSDSNPDPSTLIVRAGKEVSQDNNYNYIPFFVPIKKGDYYKIIYENSFEGKIYWMSIGN